MKRNERLECPTSRFDGARIPMPPPKSPIPSHCRWSVRFPCDRDLSLQDSLTQRQSANRYRNCRPRFRLLVQRKRSAIIHPLFIEGGAALAAARDARPELFSLAQWAKAGLTN